MALVQAGEWLRAHPIKSTGAYLTQIDNLRRRVDILGLKTQQDRTTAAVVELTQQGLSRDARALADILAWLAPDQLSETLISSLPKVSWFKRIRHNSLRYIPARIWHMAQDASRRRAAFAELRQVALLEDAEGAADVCRMHRVFQVVIRAQVAVERKTGLAKARAAAAILAAQFPKKASLVMNWPVCRNLLPHVQALWATAEPLWRDRWDRPDWAAMGYLLNQSGLFLSKQMDLSGAIALKCSALEMTEARLGEDHRAVPVALGNLALNMATTGALGEAQDMIARAFRFDEKYRKGPEREDLAARYMQQSNVAFRLIEAGAEHLHRTVWRRKRANGALVE